MVGMCLIFDSFQVSEFFQESLKSRNTAENVSRDIFLYRWEIFFREADDKRNVNGCARMFAYG